MSRAARKSKKSSASTWRKRDRQHREAEAARRRANVERRAEVNAARMLGISVDEFRRRLAEEDTDA